MDLHEEASALATSKSGTSKTTALGFRRGVVQAHETDSAARIFLMANHSFQQLPHDLWVASSAAARFLLVQYQDEAEEVRRQAALSAGMAAEYLLMGAVAGIDTSLLADRSSVPSMLALSRQNKTGRLDIQALRTINWGSALKILATANPTISISRDLEAVMSTRNAAAHLARTEDTDLAEAPARLTRIFDALKANFPDEDEQDYWGSGLATFVARLRDERATEVQIGYETKVVAAAERYRRLLGAFDPAQHYAVLAIVEGAEPRMVVAGVDGSDLVEIDCPACESLGYAHRSIVRLEDYETEVDYGRDGFPESAYVTVTVDYVPVLFECGVCGLALDESEVELLPGVGSIRGQEREILTDDEMREHFGDS